MTRGTDLARLLAGAAGVLALASCGAAPDKPRAGMWQWSSKTEIVEVTGLPAPLAAQLRAGAPPPAPGSLECISAADAAKETVDFVKARGDQSCRFDGLTASAGVFSGSAVCGEASDPMHGKGAIKGSIAPEQMHFTVDMTVALPQTKDATVHMRIQRDGKRIGDCSPKG